MWRACARLLPPELTPNSFTMDALVARLEVVTARLEAQAGGGPVPVASQPSAAPAAAGANPASVSAFADVLSGPLAKLITLSKPLGEEIVEVTTVFADAFTKEATVIATIAHCQKPTPDVLQQVLTPVGTVMMAVVQKSEGKRTDSFNHQKALAEAVQALSFVAYMGPDMGMSMPTAHVQESWQSAEFWTNKILKEFRQSKPEHAEWVAALKSLIDGALKHYVKEHHTTGPNWNATGGGAKTWKPSGGAGAVKSNTPPPPPPPPLAPPLPPPPPPPPPGASSTAATPAAGMNAVFNELNQGEAVTAGLRKVTDDMKTKNRVDRVGLVSDMKSTTSSTTAAKPSTTTVKPPKFVLEGKKWLVEHHNSNKTLVIEDVNPKQAIYIYNCVDCVITVKGKPNAITLDKCKKTALVFDDVLATCELVNCQSMQVQCIGSVPTVSIDKVDGCQVYLGEKSFNASVLTAKSSEINVSSVPSDDSEPVETPVPEQFITTRDANGKWNTVPFSGH